MIISGSRDFNWGGDLDTQWSMTNFMFLLANVVISWSSKRQLTIMLLTIEAEYKVISQVESEAIWIKRFFGKLKFI